MDRRIYLSALADAKVKLWFFALTTLILAVCCLLLSFSLHKKETVTTTVVVPYNFEKEVSIDKGRLSSSYIEIMAARFSQLLLTYQKKTVSYQFDKVLEFVAPEVYSGMSSKLKAEAKKVISSDISSVFYPSSIDIDGYKATLNGVFKNSIGSKVIVEEERVYVFEFAYKGALTFKGYKQLRKVSGDFIEIKQDDLYMVIDGDD